MKAAADNYMIKTVVRAMDLLDQFREGDAEFGITDLSNRMKLQKNNVFRLVATLSAEKYIEMNSSTGKYRLGLKARALGQLATQQVDFISHARPVLNDLKQQCHETCYFSVSKDGHTYVRLLRVSPLSLAIAAAGRYSAATDCKQQNLSLNQECLKQKRMPTVD